MSKKKRGFSNGTQECILTRDYADIQKLGSGGFGLVLQARKIDEMNFTAIKMVPLDSRKTAKETLEEAMKLSAISKHDCVVSCLSYWEDEMDQMSHKKFVLIAKPRKDEPFHSFPDNSISLKFLCIRMELCGNGNLRTWLKNRKTMDAGESLSIFIQICRGLEHIHSHKLIHRDLKPANILFDGKNAKISDLGWSVTHNSGDYNHTCHAGAALYQAPEQAVGNYGFPADYYAVGLILYELFHPESQSNVGDALLKLKYEKNIPSKLADEYPVISFVIKLLISLNPAERPNCEEIMRMIKGMLVDESMTTMASEESSVGRHCSACKNPLFGVRYKCSVCSDFWLCKTCEEKNEDGGIHPEAHDLLKIRKAPEPQDGSGNGCQHYRRKCILQCSMQNCKRFFYCRFCHDQSIKGHEMDRFKVEEIQCTGCGLKQSPRSSCLMCKLQFSKYSCLICHLFDDSENADKLIFHCHSCGICRRRAHERLEYSHCDRCSMCYPVGTSELSFQEHVCVQDAGTVPCSVCHKDMHKSREPGVLVDCHHYVHQACRRQFPDGTTKCPLCGHW